MSTSEDLPNCYERVGEPRRSSSRTPTISGTSLDTTTACSDRLSDKGTRSRPEILVASSLVETREFFDPFNTSRRLPASLGSFRHRHYGCSDANIMADSNRSQLMFGTRLGEWLTTPAQPLSSLDHRSPPFCRLVFRELIKPSTIHVGEKPWIATSSHRILSHTAAAPSQASNDITTRQPPHNDGNKPVWPRPLEASP